MFLVALAIRFWPQPVDPIRYTQEFEWHDRSVGIAKQIYNDAWESFDRKPGTGTYLYIHDGAFDTRTFDGGGYTIIGIQLPDKLAVGDTFQLSPMASHRKTFTNDNEDTFSEMQTGEFTAFQYCNPMMDWMTDAHPESSATIKILKLNNEFAVIHLKLLAVWDVLVNLEIDHEIKLKRNPRNAK